MGYGQYSGRSMGRRTKANLLTSVNAAGMLWAKFWGHNRLLVVYNDRAEYRLHDTTLVTVWHDGSRRVVITDGGFHTPTTTAAIAQALKQVMGKPISVWRARGGKLFVSVADREKTVDCPITLSL